MNARNPHDAPPQGSLVHWIRRLNTADGKAREAARQELLAIKPAPTWHLIQATHPNDGEGRQAALKTLVELAHPAAADTFVEHLENEDNSMRWLAAEGLVALGEVGLDAVLDLLRGYPPNEWLLRGTHHVLKGLQMAGFSELLSPVLAAYQSKAPEIDLPAAASAARQQRRQGRASAR